MNVAEAMVTSLSSLFTPTILFCIMNLVIGTIFIISCLKSHKKPDPVNSDPKELVRVPSFLDRVKSFKFSSHHWEQPEPFHSSAQSTDPFEEKERKVEEEVLLESHHDVQMMRSKSETSVKAPAAKGGRAKRIKKSLSEKAVVVEDQEEVDRRRPATMRERKGRSIESETATSGDDEAVDKKADDFINRFRQQLKLQRLDSLLRFKEMLNRGAGGAETNK